MHVSIFRLMTLGSSALQWNELWKKIFWIIIAKMNVDLNTMMTLTATTLSAKFIAAFVQNDFGHCKIWDDICARILVRIMNLKYNDNLVKILVYWSYCESTIVGERPFECNICQKRFTLKHSMMRHRRKHGGQGPDDVIEVLSNSEDEACSEDGPELRSSPTMAPAKQNPTRSCDWSANFSNVSTVQLV